MSNSIGIIYRLTTFGESHGPAIGGVIDGVPAGWALSADTVQSDLDERRPGGGGLATSRREPDRVRFLSGLFEGMTTGTPIGFVIENTNARSSDYDALRGIYRPSHADMTYDLKYGHRDYRGGGRASARETACRVVAGSVAAQYLALSGITISARAERIGPLELPRDADRLEALTAGLRATGDSVGGIVRCDVTGLPAGLGEPLYDKLSARLAFAMMSIPGAKGFDYGDGFDMAAMRGSEANDPFVPGPDGVPLTASNHSGGIQGGISNGAPVTMRIAFKPIATIMQTQRTVTRSGEPVEFRAAGRHDVCIVPRAVPVVRAMAAITIMDALLLSRASQPERR